MLIDGVKMTFCFTEEIGHKQTIIRKAEEMWIMNENKMPELYNIFEKIYL